MLLDFFSRCFVYFCLSNIFKADPTWLIMRSGLPFEDGSPCHRAVKRQGIEGGGLDRLGSTHIGERSVCVHCKKKAKLGEESPQLEESMQLEKAEMSESVKLPLHRPPPTVPPQL